MYSKQNKVNIKKIIIGFRIFKTLISMDLPSIWAAINSPESFKKPKVKIPEITAHKGNISHNLLSEI